LNLAACSWDAVATAMIMTIMGISPLDPVIFVFVIYIL